jgi:DNA-binding SARP family transcriptional activator/TolB-like protein
MEAGVIAGLGAPVETDRPGRDDAVPRLHIRLLGPLTIHRDGAAVALPASRKARALIAYLALAPRAVSRSQLCELLWDVPNDPRAELRWCLSKLRSIVDDPDRRRLEADGTAVALDLADCRVDAIEIARVARLGVETLPPAELQALSALFQGEFLDGLEIDRNPEFNGWLTAQRRRFQSCHVALLEQLARTANGDEVFGYLETWLGLAPFDLRAHESLLGHFSRRGQIREGEQHLAAAARLFDAEGLDCEPVRDLWRAIRAEPCATPRREAAPAVSSPDRDAGAESPAAAPRRGSIAVMPFADGSAEAPPRGGIADALAHDITTRLAKMRSLFVIAQGSVFALRDRQIGPEQAGRMLNVDYVVGGSLQRRGSRLVVAVELVETRTARLVWAEVYTRALDDAFLVLEEIGNRIVASVAAEIETVERNCAVLKPPGSLNAWESHHRGLWHLYRFTRADNEQARRFFEMAVRLDRSFAPAYAGLSTTHFQSAFLGWVPRETAIDRAFEVAGEGLAADDRDPAAHWAMGRALWLRGRQDRSLVELEQAVELSPSFALGHYTLGFVHSQGGDPATAISASDHSRLLSPFDPLMIGMLGCRAMALARLERFDEAADWSVRAAARPNAHIHIQAIAACCLALAGRLDEAQRHRTTIHRSQPGYRIADFLAAHRFAPDAVPLFRAGAQRIGLA